MIAEAGIDKFLQRKCFGKFAIFREKQFLWSLVFNKFNPNKAELYEGIFF